MQKFRELFFRITVSTKFIPEIDGLRFVAITLVFFYHLNWYVGAKIHAAWVAGANDSFLYNHIFENGNYGVQLFFVISGMVLGLPFAREHLLGQQKVSLPQYFMRRLTRLEPPYIICLMICLAGQLATHLHPLPVLIPSFLASLVYLHAQLLPQSSVWINLVTWSLEIEVQFYILAPLLAFLFLRGSRLKRRSLLIGVTGLALAVRPLFLDNWHFSASILNFIQYFLMGFLLADLYVDEWKSSPQTSPVWDITGILGWGLIAWSWGLPSGIREAVMTAAIFLTYVSVFRGLWLRRFFSLSVIAAIGGMCYSIYLLHAYIIAMVVPFTGRFFIGESYALNVLLQAVLIGAITLFISGGFYLLIEKPCMRRDWPTRLLAWARGFLRSAKPLENRIVD